MTDLALPETNAELARLMKARPAFAELYAREGLEEWR